MQKNHLAVYNLLFITCFFLTGVNAQTTKKHTERIPVNEEVNIHINTTHANVKIETWDKNEVEVTFTLEAEEKLEELFEKWDFKVTGDKNKVEIESESSHYFDFDFDFDFDMEDFNIQMDNFNFEMSDFNLDINVDDMVSDIMLGLNLEDIPPSPFGKDVSFDTDDYEKNPDAYLKKMNDKHGTKVTRKEADQWIEDLEEWAEEIEVRVDKLSDVDLGDLEERIEEQTKALQESVEKWQEENETQIEKMTEKIEKQMEGMNFEELKNFNHFDQERSNIKKTIHIKLPKKAKLHLNVRYGEVTLAENLRNINADLNYAALSANIINGKDTDISSAYAPVFVNHWKEGHLSLNHCHDMMIKKVTKINLDAQGTDIVIGTLLNSGIIHSAYGDLEIQSLGASLENLTLDLDFGSAILNLPTNALDLKYTGNQQSVFSLPKKCKLISDTKEGINRVVKAYNQKQNSGNILSVRANYGELIIK